MILKNFTIIKKISYRQQLQQHYFTYIYSQDLKGKGVYFENNQIICTWEINK
jgi:hypothetical protein